MPSTMSRSVCLKFYGIYGPAKFLCLAVGIMIIALGRKHDIADYYDTCQVCQACFDDAGHLGNEVLLFEFGKCSQQCSADIDATQHSNLIRSYPWLRGPAGRSSGVYLYEVHASLALVVLVACSVVLVLFGWVFDNWKWTDHQIVFEVGLWASFVTQIEAITLSRLFQHPAWHYCYVGAYPEAVFVANWALVIILISVFIMFELLNWCCARSSAAFVQEKSCRVASAVVMASLAAAYALFGLVVVGHNVSGPGQDWLCLAFSVVSVMGVGEAIFIYWYFPPQHAVAYEPV